MCGITGVIALTENGRQYLSKIEAGAHALRHRGPDGKGLFRDGNVAFGHTRLAVIDTTNAAAQPFHSGDGRYTIIYNGEIFNFRALRSELKKSGVKFRSDSDTEVLLELFAKEGERCLQRLNGFFAFAVFDKNDGSVFLARDRYGEKPLYVYSGTDALIFASEVKSFQQMSIPLQMDHAILNAYLQLNYVPPGPWSIFNKVAPLKPGTAFHFIPGS
ncbi:MAG TPA: asparagine synthetase B, partial [Bacteroidia bacterium]|nr:asparagine synthetase B [Bacteroidia bacterium]